MNMMKCVCPACGHKFDYEEEEEMEDELEGGEDEGKIVVKEVDVPDDKEEMIKKKLMELGKLMASISK